MYIYRDPRPLQRSHNSSTSPATEHNSEHRDSTTCSPRRALYSCNGSALGSPLPRCVQPDMTCCHTGNTPHTKSPPRIHRVPNILSRDGYRTGNKSPCLATYSVLRSRQLFGLDQCDAPLVVHHVQRLAL